MSQPHQINLVFLSNETMDLTLHCYNDELNDLITKLVSKLKMGIPLFKPGFLIGEELIYKNKTFNIILKNNG